jgi:hypothetical protein
VVRVICWNVGGRELWDGLTSLDADIALLQEARLPPAGRPFDVIPADTSAWSTAGWQGRAWPTAVARLSDRVELVPVPTVGIEAAASASDWSVSRHGTVTAAHVALNRVDEWGESDHCRMLIDVDL